MADYTTLQADIVAWFPRTDLPVTSCISLFESRLNREIRVRQMEAVATLTPVSGVAPLPTDFLQQRRVVWTGSPSVDLDYATPDYIQDFYLGQTGNPNVYTIMGSNLIVGPSNDTALTLNYYQIIPSLSVSNLTNWFLLAHYDAYLKGALVEAFTFERKVDAAEMWESRLQQALQEVTRLDQRQRGNPQIRVVGVTP